MWEGGRGLCSALPMCERACGRHPPTPPPPTASTPPHPTSARPMKRATCAMHPLHHHRHRPLHLHTPPPPPPHLGEADEARDVRPRPQVGVQVGLPRPEGALARCHMVARPRRQRQLGGGEVACADSRQSTGFVHRVDKRAKGSGQGSGCGVGDQRGIGARLQSSAGRPGGWCQPVSPASALPPPRLAHRWHAAPQRSRPSRSSRPSRRSGSKSVLPTHRPRWLRPAAWLHLAGRCTTPPATHWSAASQCRPAVVRSKVRVEVKRRLISGVRAALIGGLL